MLVIIKGSRPEAIRALCARGITEIISIEESPRWNEITVRTPDHNWPKVVRWFAEPPGRAPFPPGTCLFYQHMAIQPEARHA